VHSAELAEGHGVEEVSVFVFLMTSCGASCCDFLWCFLSVLCRPCVLVMDSLKLACHQNICRLLRESVLFCSIWFRWRPRVLTLGSALRYLQVEWEVHRGTPRLFTADSVRSCSCRVPQQDNSSDCGLYLLQYAESFLQVGPPENHGGTTGEHVGDHGGTHGEPRGNTWRTTGEHMGEHMGNTWGNTWGTHGGTHG